MGFGLTDKDYQNRLLKEFREEADFINEFYGLGDNDHLTAIELGHIYELMKEYKNNAKNKKRNSNGKRN